MTNSIVPSITDEQLADIEQYVNTTQRRSSEVENGDIAAIIARLRAAEDDAARYRHQFGNEDWWDYDELWCGASKAYVDSEIDAAMERTP